MLESLFWLFLGYEIGTGGKLTSTIILPFARNIVREVREDRHGRT
jgi:hypothetical protein